MALAKRRPESLGESKLVPKEPSLDPPFDSFVIPKGLRMHAEAPFESSKINARIHAHGKSGCFSQTDRGMDGFTG